MPTTSRGAPFPSVGGSNNAPEAIQQLAQWASDHAGTSTMTAAERTALTGAALWAGRTVHESDTDHLVLYTGSTWERIALHYTPAQFHTHQATQSGNDNTNLALGDIVATDAFSKTSSSQVTYSGQRATAVVSAEVRLDNSSSFGLASSLAITANGVIVARSAGTAAAQSQRPATLVAPVVLDPGTVLAVRSITGLSITVTDLRLKGLTMGPA